MIQHVRSVKPMPTPDIYAAGKGFITVDPVFCKVQPISVSDSGPVDVLVCAAANEASSPFKEVETTPLDDFEQVMRGNWLSTIAAIQGALEHMKERFGEAPTRIAIISSLASQVSFICSPVPMSVHLR
jgi:NAD(P)-dependent dehydrogenase (short-subunit alcohol dehydrogenase family)